MAGAVPTAHGAAVEIAAHARPLGGGHGGGRSGGGGGGGGGLRVALAVSVPRGTSGAVELPVPAAYRNGSFTARLMRTPSAALSSPSSSAAGAGGGSVQLLRRKVAAAVAAGGACGAWGAAGAGRGAFGTELVRHWAGTGAAGEALRTAAGAGGAPLAEGFTYFLCWEGADPAAAAALGTCLPCCEEPAPGQPCCCPPPGCAVPPSCTPAPAPAPAPAAPHAPHAPRSRARRAPRRAAFAARWNASAAAEHFNYTVTYRGQDKATGGKWRGKFGSKGFVLFNYTKSAAASTTAASGGSHLGGAPAAAAAAVDAVSLPPFVEAVWAGNRERSGSFEPLGGRHACKFDGPFGAALGTADGDGAGSGAIGSRGSCAADLGAAANASDPRVPEAPDGGAPGRASAISAIGWKGSFHVDVKLKDGAPTAPAPPPLFNVTLYFADYARWHVRQVVLVAELASQDKVALPVLVEDFGERGAYLTYEARCSLRFRIHQVHSEQGDRQGWAPPPIMTGIFFD